MSETLIIALASAGSALAGALIQAAVANHRHHFDEALIIQQSIEDNQLLWLWNRELVDHIYRGASPPPPPPPTGLFDSTQHGRNSNNDQHP